MYITIYRFNSAGDYTRGNNRTGGRNAFQDGGSNSKNDEQYNKRKHETKTVFSRFVCNVLCPTCLQAAAVSAYVHIQLRNVTSGVLIAL